MQCTEKESGHGLGKSCCFLVHKIKYNLAKITMVENCMVLAPESRST